MSKKEEIKDEKKYNIVYQNNDVVVAFRVKEEEEWSTPKKKQYRVCIII